MIEVRTNIDKLSKNLVKFLDRLGDRLLDVRTPLKESGIQMLRSIDNNFKVGGRPNKWRPLAQSTINARRKGKGKGGPQILQDNGILKGSITTRTRKDFVAIGTSIPYAPVHNFGHVFTRARKAKLKGKSRLRARSSTSGIIIIPKRPFILFQEEDKKDIDDIFVKHMGKTLTKEILNFK